jgi:hypothetical protein
MNLQFCVNFNAPFLSNNAHNLNLNIRFLIFFDAYLSVLEDFMWLSLLRFYIQFIVLSACTLT